MKLLTSSIFTLKTFASLVIVWLSAILVFVDIPELFGGFVVREAISRVTGPGFDLFLFQEPITQYGSILSFA